MAIFFATSILLLVLCLLWAWSKRQTWTKRAFLDFSIEHDLILNDRFTGLMGYNFSSFCRQDWELTRQQFANQTLLIFENRSFTYQQIDEYAHSLAVELRERWAVKPGHVVVSALEMRPEGLVVLLACTLLGTIHAPVTPFLSKNEVAGVIATLGEVAVVVVAGGPAEARWRAAHTNIFFFDLESPSFRGAAASHRVVPYKWALHETMVLMSTSGSTGTPKFVEAAARAFTTYSEIECRVTRYRMLITAGWEANTVMFSMYRGLRRGASFVLSVDHASKVCHPDAARNWLDLMIKHKVTFLVLYPPMTVALKGFNDSIPAMRTISLTGQSPNEQACKAIQHMFPNAVWVHSYGLSEGMGKGGTTQIWRRSMSDSFPSNFFTSVGQWPNKTGQQLFDRKLVYDPSFPKEKGYPVGEFRVRLLMHQFKGYWRNPELTAETFDENGYIRTKDLAYVDDEGFVYLAGRVDDVIKHTITGKQIYPRVVEEAFESHPNVSLVGVVPKRNEAGSGSQAVACVVTRGHVTKAALMDHTSPRLAEFQLPEAIYFLKSLPLTKNGKVSRKVLKNMVADSELLDEAKMRRNITISLLQGADEDGLALDGMTV